MADDIVDKLDFLTLQTGALSGFVPDLTPNVAYVAPPKTLPASYSLRKYVSSTANQLQISSCTANAVTSACELIHGFSGSQLELSRLFNYYLSREARGLLPQDAGAYIKDALEGAYVVGLPSEETWPYDATKVNTPPSSAAYAEAATLKMGDFRYIDLFASTAVVKIKTALTEGLPIVLGTYTNKSFAKLGGTLEAQAQFPWGGITLADPQTGAHALYIIGYDDTYSAFIVHNSWGITWGYRGYALIPYTLFNGLTIIEAWTVEGFGGVTLPKDENVVDNGVPVDPIAPVLSSDGRAITPTLIKGSQLIYAPTTLIWLDIIFVKGFAIDATLKVSYLPTLNSLRFWVEESVGDSLSLVNTETIVEAIVALPSAILGADTYPAYSKSGAVVIFRIDITHFEYKKFIQATVLQAERISKSASEVLSLVQLTSIAATNLNGSTNRESGLSIFDGSYVSAFNKRITMPASFSGYIHFLNSGFSKGMLVTQTLDAVTGDILLAVANSSDPATAMFGTPVVTAKNNGTLASPLYAYPDNPFASLPNLKYFFTANSYGTQPSTTSPFPYLIAKAPDGSAFVFTSLPTILTKAAVAATPVSFDFGAHYLGLFHSINTSNSVRGYGGAVSTEVLSPAIVIAPTRDITGVRIVSTGGLTSTKLRLKQRSATTSQQVILQGNFPMLDLNNRVFVSFAEDNDADSPAKYGAEADITESGTYVLHSKASGSITIVTNRLLYNPYFSGSETLKYGEVQSDLLKPVTPSQLLNGSIDYVCFYVKNRHPTKSFAKVSIWSDLNCNNLTSSELNPQYLQFGMLDLGTRKGDGSDNLLTTRSDEAPLNLVFNFSNAESEAMVILDLLPNQSVPIWIKRVVKANGSVNKQDVLSFLRMKVMY